MSCIDAIRDSRLAALADDGGYNVLSSCTELFGEVTANVSAGLLGVSNSLLNARFVVKLGLTGEYLHRQWQLYQCGW